MFRRPLSALRADPTPLVAPTVLWRASDAHRRSTPVLSEVTTNTEGIAGEVPGSTAGGAASTPGGGVMGGLGWAKRGFGLVGGPSFGTTASHREAGDGERASVGGGSSIKRGVRDVMSKFKRGRRFGGGWSGEVVAAAAAEASEAVVMAGVGVTESGFITVSGGKNVF